MVNIQEPQEAERFPEHRHEVLKWNGWGYSDSSFYMNESGIVSFRGKRYELGGMELPLLREWMEVTRNMNFNNPSPSQASIDALPVPTIVDAFVKEVEGKKINTSTDPQDRLFRAHGQLLTHLLEDYSMLHSLGHTCEEIYKLRHGTYTRIPDLVVWPEKHDHVVAIVAAACKHNVVIIPFGGMLRGHLMVVLDGL